MTAGESKTGAVKEVFIAAREARRGLNGCGWREEEGRGTRQEQRAGRGEAHRAG